METIIYIIRYSIFVMLLIVLAIATYKEQFQAATLLGVLALLMKPDNIDEQ